MNLEEFLQREIRGEQKWMYHFNIDDPCFGIETDKCRICKNLLEGRQIIENTIIYLEKFYPNEERNLINKLKEYQKKMREEKAKAKAEHSVTDVMLEKNYKDLWD